MQEKPMSGIRVYPGLIIDGDGSKVIFTLTPIIGETREDYEHRCQEVFKLAVSHVAPSSPTFEVADTSKYRKVGDHAYEIITHGYESKEETGNERDTHFAGFAKLLYEDFLQLAREDESNINEMLASDYPDKWRAKVKQCITQRAYDLVWHTLHAVGMDDDSIPFQDVYRPEEDIPDLTEWPE